MGWVRSPVQQGVGRPPGLRVRPVPTRLVEGEAGARDGDPDAVPRGEDLGEPADAEGQLRDL